MFGEQSILGLVDPRREERGSALIGMNFFNKAPISSADLGLAGSLFKPKDLVRLLLTHGARARRATVPRTGIRLHVLTPSGRPAVHVDL